MTDYIRISFTKDFWPFVSGDDLVVKRRAGDWFIGGGYAVRIPERKEPQPVAPLPVKAAEVKPAAKSEPAVKKAT